MAYSLISVSDLAELKTRRGNSTNTTMATIMGLSFPIVEAFSVYVWDNLSTAIPDDDEIIQPTVGGIPTGRWFKVDLDVAPQVNSDWNALVGVALILNKPTDLGAFTNGPGYITSYFETDPLWTAAQPSYRTKVQNDLLYQPIGSYLTSETDPTVPSYSKSLIGFAVIKTDTDLLYEPLFVKNTAFNRNFGTTSNTVAEGNDNRIVNGQTSFGWGNHALVGYLTSFTENDPTVPAYAKSLTNFSVIKSDTDLLYKSISYVPSFSDITGKPTTIGGYGITDFNSLGDARWGALLHTHTFASLTSKPTTLSGYGITDAYPLTGNPSGFLTANQAITLSGDVTGSGSTSITTTLTNVGTAGTYGIITTDSKGRVTSGKRTETYSGTTNASGVYTVTFGTSYSVAPNIQANIINQSSTNQFLRVSSISTTGFTINVFQRNSVNLLGIDVLLSATANTSGASVDVLITEK